MVETVERFGQRQELIMEFPCNFPIKVVGSTHTELHLRVCEIAVRHDTQFSPAQHLQHRHSSTGKYQSLTLHIQATSKEQIDAIYQDLKACELVLWAL